jgi:hypothetical protein
LIAHELGMQSAAQEKKRAVSSLHLLNFKLTTVRSSLGQEQQRWKWEGPKVLR